MNSEHVCEDVANSVRGDLRAFSRMALLPHQSIQRCAASLPPLIVDAHAVRRVLQAFREKRVPPELVQGWASFVRRGHLPGVAGPIKPIEIDYELCAEDQIAEIISRLDEIGDVIDGEVSDSEIESMLDGLQRLR